MVQISLQILTAHWYAYCGGNPIMFVDPMGLWVQNREQSQFVKELSFTDVVITNPEEAAKKAGYTEFIGYFYVSKK